MRLLTSQALVTLLTLLSAPVFACKQLVQFPEHLTGNSANWSDAYRVVEIDQAYDDRIVGHIANNLGAEPIEKKVVFFYLPNEEAHAICETRFNIGETYLVFSTTRGHRREISRFNWMNVPKSHERFETYVEDLQRASAANKSLGRTRAR
jgi:hypothetical protein